MAETLTWKPPTSDKIEAWSPPASDPVSTLLDPSKSPEVALREKEAIGVRTQVRRDRERFVSQNVQPGVPLDLDAELPAGTRARVSFESNIDKQADLLAKQEGVLGARKSKDGRNVIVRITDESGKPKDVLLHPKTSTLTAGDIAGAAGPLAKTAVAGGIAALTSGASLPLTAVAMGGGAALTEAAMSGGSRLLAEQPIDAKELAGAAGTEGAINAAIPLAGAAVKAGAQKVRSAILSNVGQLEKKVPAAAGRLGVTPTLAETTGSPTLAKIGKLTPGEDDARQMALRVAKDRETVLGGGKPGPLATESEIAESVQPLFAESEKTAAKGVRTAMTDAEQAAQRQIQSELDSGIIPTTKSTSEVGDFIRGKIAGKADSKSSELRTGAEKLYGTANALAEKEGIAVAPSNVSKLRAEIDADTHKALLEFAPGIKKIPALDAMLTKEQVKDTGLLDEFGRAIQELVPPKPMTVSQARELRSVVYEMAHTPGPPGEGGVPRRYLTRLYKALDDDLDTAIKSGTPELQKAHATADEFYKSKIQPLQQSDVAKLFLETDAAGRMGGDEIVRRLFRGAGNLDALRSYRNVLGKDSPEWKLLVRQGLQTVMEDAGALAGRVDAGAFLKRIEQLSKTELADEIIGPVAQSLRANAKLAARSQGVKIPIDELEDALTAAPKAVSARLESAIAREEAYDKTYNSAIQKQLRDGALGPRTMGNIDDFLSRFIEGAHTSVKDVRQALTQIAAKDKNAVETIRQRVLHNVLEDARALGPLGKQTTREIEDMSHEKLARYLTGDMRNRYQAILGDRGMKFLHDLAIYAEATAKRQAAEIGRKVTPETMAKEVASGMAGFRRNAIGALVDIGSASARALGGSRAVRSEAVRKFIETGQLPSLGATARMMVLASPQAADAKDAILAEKPKASSVKNPPVVTPEPTSPPPPPVQEQETKEPDPPPAPVTPPQKKVSQFKEGRIYRDPETGVRMRYRNGEFVNAA